MFAPAASAETLSDLATREAIPLSEPVMRHAARPVFSADSLESPFGRTLAAAIDDDGSLLVLLFTSSAAQRWRMAELRWPADGCRGGSIDGLYETDAFYFIEGHVNPSAACTLVASKRDLSVRGVFDGWIRAVLDHDEVVYQHSEPHFAPTHYVELSLYNAAPDTSRQLYPPRPSPPIRRRYQRQVQSAYDRCQRNEATRRACGGAFAENNHHGDARLFDNWLGDLVANPATDAIAFQITFDDIAKASPVEVIYIYRHVSDPRRMQLREFLRTDLYSRYGKGSLGTYLQPAVLRRLFAPRGTR